MQLRELQLYLHLCRSLHFGKTSMEYHISPSSLTRVIQKLEHEVGTVLFERDNRTVILTPAGHRFRLYAADTLERWGELKRDLLEVSERISGKLSIFCSVTASYSFLHELLDQFRALYPEVEIHLHTGDTALTIQRILNEEEDVGIAAKPEMLSERLCFRPIRNSSLVFIAPVAACPLREQLISLESSNSKLSWEHIPLVLSESGLARDRIDDWFRNRGIRPNIYAQVAGNEAIVSMVSLGFGIGVVPSLVVENSPLRQKIEILDVKPELESISIGVCALRRKLSNPLIRAFWELSQEHMISEHSNLEPQ
jgi:LysR family positive regulator for ilvC